MINIFIGSSALPDFICTNSIIFLHSCTALDVFKLLCTFTPFPHTHHHPLSPSLSCSLWESNSFAGEACWWNQASHSLNILHFYFQIPHGDLELMSLKQFRLSQGGDAAFLVPLKTLSLCVLAQTLTLGMSVCVVISVRGDIYTSVFQHRVLHVWQPIEISKHISWPVVMD